jgi:hypothetical protein
MLNSDQLHWSEKLAMLEDWDFYFNKPIVPRYNLMIFIFDFFLLLTPFAFLALVHLVTTFGYFMTQAITSGGIRVCTSEEGVRGYFRYVGEFWSLIFTFLPLIPLHDEKVRSALEGVDGKFTRGQKMTIWLQTPFRTLCEIFRSSIVWGIILLVVFQIAPLHPYAVVARFFFYVFPIAFIFGPFTKNGFWLEVRGHKILFPKALAHGLLAIPYVLIVDPFVRLMEWSVMRQVNAYWKGVKEEIRRFNFMSPEDKALLIDYMENDWLVKARQDLAARSVTPEKIKWDMVGSMYAAAASPVSVRPSFGHPFLVARKIGAEIRAIIRSLFFARSVARKFGAEIREDLRDMVLQQAEELFNEDNDPAAWDARKRTVRARLEALDDLAVKETPAPASAQEPAAKKPSRVSRLGRVDGRGQKTPYRLKRAPAGDKSRQAADNFRSRILRGVTRGVVVFGGAVRDWFLNADLPEDARLNAHGDVDILVQVEFSAQEEEDLARETYREIFGVEAGPVRVAVAKNGLPGAYLDYLNHGLRNALSGVMTDNSVFKNFRKKVEEALQQPVRFGDDIFEDADLTDAAKKIASLEEELEKHKKDVKGSVGKSLKEKRGLYEHGEELQKSLAQQQDDLTRQFVDRAGELFAQLYYFVYWNRRQALARRKLAEEAKRISLDNPSDDIYRRIVDYVVDENPQFSQQLKRFGASSPVGRGVYTAARTLDSKAQGRTKAALDEAYGKATYTLPEEAEEQLDAFDEQAKIAITGTPGVRYEDARKMFVMTKELTREKKDELLQKPELTAYFTIIDALFARVHLSEDAKGRISRVEGISYDESKRSLTVTGELSEQDKNNLLQTDALRMHQETINSLFAQVQRRKKVFRYGELSEDIKSRVPAEIELILSRGNIRIVTLTPLARLPVAPFIWYETIDRFLLACTDGVRTFIPLALIELLLSNNNLDLLRRLVTHQERYLGNQPIDTIAAEQISLEVLNEILQVLISEVRNKFLDEDYSEDDLRILSGAVDNAGILRPAEGRLSNIRNNKIYVDSHLLECPSLLVLEIERQLLHLLSGNPSAMEEVRIMLQVVKRFRSFGAYRQQEDILAFLEGFGLKESKFYRLLEQAKEETVSFQGSVATINGKRVSVLGAVDQNGRVYLHDDFMPFFKEGIGALTVDRVGIDLATGDTYYEDKKSFDDLENRKLGFVAESQERELSFDKAFRILRMVAMYPGTYLEPEMREQLVRFFAAASSSQPDFAAMAAWQKKRAQLRKDKAGVKGTAALAGPAVAGTGAQPAGTGAAPAAAAAGQPVDGAPAAATTGAAPAAQAEGAAAGQAAPAAGGTGAQPAAAAEEAAPKKTVDLSTIDVSKELGAFFHIDKFTGEIFRDAVDRDAAVVFLRGLGAEVFLKANGVDIVAMSRKDFPHSSGRYLSDDARRASAAVVYYFETNGADFKDTTSLEEKEAALLHDLFSDREQKEVAGLIAEVSRETWQAYTVLAPDDQARRAQLIETVMANLRARFGADMTDAAEQLLRRKIASVLDWRPLHQEGWSLNEMPGSEEQFVNIVLRIAEPALAGVGVEMGAASPVAADQNLKRASALVYVLEDQATAQETLKQIYQAMRLNTALTVTVVCVKEPRLHSRDLLSRKGFDALIETVALQGLKAYVDSGRLAFAEVARVPESVRPGLYGDRHLRPAAFADGKGRLTVRNPGSDLAGNEVAADQTAGQACADRAGQPFVYAIADMDNLKDNHETYGSELRYAGKVRMVVAEVIDAINERYAGTGIVVSQYSYGGDKSVILIRGPVTQENAAGILAEICREVPRAGAHRLAVAELDIDQRNAAYFGVIERVTGYRPVEWRGKYFVLIDILENEDAGQALTRTLDDYNTILERDYSLALTGRLAGQIEPFAISMGAVYVAGRVDFAGVQKEAYQQLELSKNVLTKRTVRLTTPQAGGKFALVSMYCAPAGEMNEDAGLRSPWGPWPRKRETVSNSPAAAALTNKRSWGSSSATTADCMKRYTSRSCPGSRKISTSG